MQAQKKGRSQSPGKGCDLPFHALYAYHNSTACCAAEQRLTITGTP